MNKIISLVCLLLCAINLYSQNAVINAAENGDIDAQKWLAEQYFDGKNTNYPRNIRLSFKWYLAAARQGDAECQYKLGTCKDFTPAFQTQNEADAWCMKAADQGHLFAAWIIGRELLDKKDDRALKYLEIAGPIANIEIGQCYLKGIGTSRNVEKAKSKFLEVIEFLKEPADDNNDAARVNVAEAYRLLALISWNEDKEEDALKYAWSCGDYGFASGYRLAAEILLNLGDEKDAVETLKKGAKLGDAECMARIGELAYKDGHLELAIDCFMNALEVDKHCETALRNIGWCHYQLKNYTKAKEYFGQAIEEELPIGYNQMAYLYANGFGVRKDLKEAHRLVDIALSKVEIGSNDYVNHLDTKGEFYVIEGNENEARDIWKQMMALNENCENWKTYFVQHMLGITRESIDDIGNFTARNDNVNTFVVAIGNENYKYEEDVPFANNDVKTFADYCHRILGVPQTNIKMIEDAGYNDMRYVISWLTKVISVFGKEAKVIFYYAGHGIPNASNKSGYLLPVDGYGSDTATGYSLSDLYASLGTLPAKSVNIFLDACFSGSTREGKILDAARGVAIKVNESSPIGNMVVISASQGDETAYPYDSQRHGLFTYFLLKKLQETEGYISLGELSSYVKENVSKRSIVEKGKSQTPCINPSKTLDDTWKKWTLK